VVTDKGWGLYIESCVVSSYVIYPVAAVLAILGLLIPMLGRQLCGADALSQSTAERSSDRFTLRRSRLFLLFGLIWLVTVVLLAVVCMSSTERTDWVLFVPFSAALVFGLSKDNFRFGLVPKLIVLLALSFVPPLLGIRLPFTGGAILWLDILLTAIFIMGFLNALAVVNFINGFSSMVVFLGAACLAVMFEAAIFTPGTLFESGSSSVEIPGIGDGVGVVFALALCGASLSFFFFHRPQSRRYMGDLGTVLLGLLLALLTIRVLSRPGGESPSPVAFLPLVLILPLLAAGTHREYMSLVRRQRLTLILIVAGHIPLWIPYFREVWVNLFTGDAIALERMVSSNTLPYSSYALLGIASTILCAALVTQSRVIRGWSMRVMSEPIADLLRFGFLIAFVDLVVAFVLRLEWMYVAFAVVLTFVFLIGQVTVWRRRVLRAGTSKVVIVGQRKNYDHARRVLNLCSDLIGRHAIERCRVGPASHHLRSVVAEHLRQGDTVLVLQDRARMRLLGLRSLGDLIFASDCLLLHNINRKPADRWHEILHERLQDYSHRFLAFFGLIVLSPIFLLIIVIIKLDDGGPVLFRQRRMGQGGRRFTFYKFRSMRVDTPKYGESPASANDSRVTRVGQIMRRLSLDELPQLYNVIRGDMRLVGPRPEMPFICSRYTPRERQRLEVTPGITGLFQVSLDRHNPIMLDHVEYDLAYAESQNPFLDVAIIIATFIGSKGGH